MKSKGTAGGPAEQHRPGRRGRPCRTRPGRRVRRRRRAGRSRRRGPATPRTAASSRSPRRHWDVLQSWPGRRRGRRWSRPRSRAACREQRAEAAGGARERAPRPPGSARPVIQHRHRGPAGADQRDGVRGGQRSRARPCSAATGATASDAYPPLAAPQVRHHPPPGPGPAARDDAGHLPPRRCTAASATADHPAEPRRSVVSTRCTPHRRDLDQDLVRAEAPDQARPRTAATEGSPNSYCRIAFTPPTVEPRHRLRARADGVPGSTPGDSLRNVSRAGFPR